MRTELPSLEQKPRREPGLSGRALPHPVATPSRAGSSPFPLILRAVDPPSLLPP